MPGFRHEKLPYQEASNALFLQSCFGKERRAFCKVLASLLQRSAIMATTVCLARRLANEDGVGLGSADTLFSTLQTRPDRACREVPVQFSRQGTRHQLKAEMQHNSDCRRSCSRQNPL